MMVRERLTGESPPATARKLVDLWRPLIEERAGRNLDRLERVLTDQRRFGDVVHDLLDCARHGRGSQQRCRRGGGRSRATRRTAATNPARTATPPIPPTASGMSLEEADASTDDLPDSAAEAVDAPAADMADDAEMGDSETAAEPWRPRHQSQRAARARLSGLSPRNSTKTSTPKICAMRKSLRGCAIFWISSLRPFKVWCRGSPTAATAADGAAKPLLGIRS